MGLAHLAYTERYEDPARSKLRSLLLGLIITVTYRTANTVAILFSGSAAPMCGKPLTFQWSLDI
jgi:hypothetical protein